MKYQKLFSILLVTGGIWALSAPACDRKAKDPLAADGAPDELAVSPAFGIGVKEPGETVNVMVTVNADGKGAENVKVQFTVVSGGGTVSAAETRTDKWGITRVNWTLGAPGRQHLQIKANDNAALVWDITGETKAAPLAAIMLSPDTLRLNVGQTGTFTVQGRNTKGEAVAITAGAWKSLDTNIAEVHVLNGTVTARAAGVTRIVAVVDENSLADTAWVRVTAPQQPATTVDINANATMHMYRVGSGSFSGTGLAAGDSESDGNGTVQGFLLFDLAAIPATANITSAKIRISADAGNFFNNPFVLGALYLEASPGNLPALSDDPVATASAVQVMTTAQQNVEVDVTNIIKANRAAGTVWLRLRFANAKNNNNTSEVGQFSAGPLKVTY